MLRKLALAFVAAASLGAVALSPTIASAAGHGGHGGGHGGWHGGGHGGWHGGHGGWHGGYHRGWGGPRFYVGGPYAYGGCTVRRLVPTPWGPRWRWVNRCY